MSKKVEFGDFQTPLSLALKCTDLLKISYKPTCVIEPTCGLGFFLEAADNTWGPNIKLYGYEINKTYLDSFSKRSPNIFKRAEVEHADFFDLQMSKVVGVSNNPFILGNPPWVTNSQLGVLDSKNLPKKSNIKGLSGFEALSGKSNFDISEWMIMNLCKELSPRKGVLAMLCKTSVARNVFLHNYKTAIKDVTYKIYRIDSKKEFNVSVDACLFVADFLNGGDEKKCDIYQELSPDSFENSIGINDGKIIADIDMFSSTQDMVQGASDLIWRSGVKHDASKVMELKLEGDQLKNGFGELVDVESDLVYPLLKSSDIANNRLDPRRFVIVTQKKVGDDTITIKEQYPKLWNYLNKHSEKLDGRKSSIYKKQPRFSIFGIGEYSFKPYKIAISGLYKNLNFSLLTPLNGKPIMVDDTCYLLGFDSLKDAEFCLKTLTSKLVTDYITSLIFWDSKRPVNSDILKSIDLDKAAGSYSQYSSVAQV